MSAAETDLKIAPEPADIVMLLARKGRADDLLALLGFDLPAPGRALVTAEMALLWLQPAGWLVLATPAPEGALARRLRRLCGDAASVIDQTHGRVRLALAGTGVRAALARSCRLDLHPARFAVGDVATTDIAHVTCTLHRHAGGYDLIAPSTLVGSLLERLG